MTVRIKEQRLGTSLRYVLLTSGTLLLLFAAGGSGAMTRTIEAQAPVAGVGSESGKSQRHKGKSCTYYDAQSRPYPGTCGTKKEDKGNYYCYRNDDEKMNEVQKGCAAKSSK